MGCRLFLGKHLQRRQRAIGIRFVDDSLLDLFTLSGRCSQSVGEIAVLLSLYAADAVDGSSAAQSDQPSPAGPAFGVEPGAPGPDFGEAFLEHLLGE